MDFSIDIKEKDGLRTLHFDARWTQGAMRIAQSWHLELEYTRVMMACLLLRDAGSFPRNVLLVGLGAGSLTKFLYRHCPSAHLTAVEIDARVAEVARQSFELPDDAARLDIVIADGVEYMQTTDKTFDLILVDGFNEHAHPGDLNALPFYQACRARLSEQGALVVNLIGLSHGVKGGFAHIEAAFDGRALMFPKCKSGNTIAFATMGGVSIPLRELKERAAALEHRTGLALMPTLNKLEHEPFSHAGVLRI
jgi:spermidine synthase